MRFVSVYLLYITRLGNLPMISSRGFGKELLVLGKLLFIWERYAVNSLQGVIVRVSEEV